MRPISVIRRLLRDQGDHYRRRLTRMDILAANGRLSPERFRFYGEDRSFVEGLAAAYAEALQILGDDVALDGEIDQDMMCVVDGARRGKTVEEIAAWCGISVRDVAETLVRYVQARDTR